MTVPSDGLSEGIRATVAELDALVPADLGLATSSWFRYGDSGLECFWVSLNLDRDTIEDIGGPLLSALSSVAASGAELPALDGRLTDLLAAWDGTTHPDQMPHGIAELGTGCTVAQATCYRARVADSRGWSLFEALDEESADLAHFSPLCGPDGHGLDPDLEDALWTSAEYVLIIDRAETRPAWRRRGLGSLLVISAVDLLHAGCSVVAIHPAPFAPEDTVDEVTRETVRQGLVRLWGRVGFHPWKDGISILDPADSEWTEIYEACVSVAVRADRD